MSLAGVSPDGDHLLLTDGDGGAFTLVVDARLRAALRQSEPQPPPGPPEPRMEKPMDSVLRPRDIQARIRAGESAEQVAAAAQTTVERVLPYAGPVLAEREHVAGRALKSSLRRPGAEGGARTLGDAVESHLRTLHLDPAGLVEWDAWRREDGRWSITGRFSVHRRDGVDRDGTGEFTFDPPGNFVVLDNDDARWLVGDLPDAEPEAPAAEPSAGVRRLSAVREPRPHHDADQLSIDDELGLDAVHLVTDSPVEAFLDDREGLDESELVDEAADAAALDRDPRPADGADQEPPARRPIRKTRGRASVPSWDEIMFGGGTKPE